MQVKLEKHRVVEFVRRGGSVPLGAEIRGGAAVTPVAVYPDELKSHIVSSGLVDPAKASVVYQRENIVDSSA